MKKLLKQPLFIIGFIIFMFFFAGSFIYEWIYGAVIEPTYIIWEDGRAVEAPPISPRPGIWLGTDALGYSMFAKIMIGGKFTILAAMAVAFVRMLVAIPLGYVIGTYWQKQREWINGLIDPMHYIPLTLFAFTALYPILWEPRAGFSTTLFERMVYEVVILALITAPIVASLISKEANLLYNQEYILASKTLGASRRRIIVKHLIPQMREKLFVLYAQQVIETLIVFAHLGLLKLFLGGTAVDYDPVLGDPPKSISYEWAGLFGDSFRYLQGAPWLPLSPAVSLALVIFSIAAMIEGYTRATNGQVSFRRKKKRMRYVPDEVIDWNQEEFKKKLRILENK